MGRRGAARICGGFIGVLIALCCLGISALDGELLLAGYFSRKPHLLVRYAADPCDSGAAARHEKGGGGMTYIENIFLCMVSPCWWPHLCMGRRQLRFFLFCIAGMGVCLLSALYQHLPRGGMSGGRPFAATAEIAPVVEEMMKLLPLVFYLLVFEPEDKSRPPPSRLPSPSPPLKMCAISSRTARTASPSSSSVASARRAMHVLCGLIVGGGLAYVAAGVAEGGRYLRAAGRSHHPPRHIQSAHRLRRRGTVHRLHPAGAAGGGGKVVCFPLIAEEITEHSLLESCFWRLSIFLEKNFAFWVRVFSIFCTYISEGVFLITVPDKPEGGQTKCTMPQNGSHSSKQRVGKTPAGGSGTASMD